MKALVLYVTVVYCLASARILFADSFDRELVSAAEEIKTARSALSLIAVKYPETEVSEQAIRKIQDLKEHLEELATIYVDKTGHDLSEPHSVNASVLEVELNRLIGARRPSPNGNYPTDVTINNFAREVWFEAAIDPGETHHLLIKATLSIPCGTDSVLLVFQQNEHGWQKTLTWKSPPYGAIHGAINALQYLPPVPGPKRSWYVLGAYRPARCASCWGQLRVVALRPKDRSSEPEIVFQESFDEYQCDQEPLLTAETDGFDIKFIGRGEREGELTLARVFHHSLR